MVRSAWSSAASKYLAAIEKDTSDVNVIVEIGVDLGYSLFTLARDFPNALVVGVDNFSYSDGEAAKAHVEKYLIDFPNVRLLAAESGDANRWWKDPSNYLDIDLLHIDGDHMYDSVKRDFELWSTFVSPDGVVMLHDVCSFKEHVGRLFDEISWKKKLIDENGPGLGILFKDG